MTERKTEFIFAIAKLSEEDIEMMGTDFTIEVATKVHFDKHGHMQDGYDEADYDELTRVMDKYDAAELAESSFECEMYTAGEITAKLNSEPNFNFSQKFQDYLDSI